MPLRFKIDVMKALKEKGVTTYAMRKDKLLSESTIQKLRKGVGVSWENIETLCELLQCQPGDLIEYVEENEPKVEQVFFISSLESNTVSLRSGGRGFRVFCI